MIISIYLIVVVFFLGLIFLINKQEKSKRMGFIISLLITMFATFMGVYLAFEISDYQNQIEGKELLEANINRTISELNREMNNLKFLLIMSNDTNVSMIDNNPIIELHTLNLLLADSNLPRYGSTVCTETIISSIRTLDKMMANLNDRNLPPDRRYLYLEMYYYEIKYTNKVLNLELDYLHGNINEENLEEKRQDLISQKISRTL